MITDSFTPFRSQEYTIEIRENICQCTDPINDSLYEKVC